MSKLSFKVLKSLVKNGVTTKETLISKDVNNKMNLSVKKKKRIASSVMMIAIAVAIEAVEETLEDHHPHLEVVIEEAAQGSKDTGNPTIMEIREETMMVAPLVIAMAVALQAMEAEMINADTDK